MALRKHAVAKIIAAGAALASMLGLWAVVRNDPPPATDAATSAPVAAQTPATSRQTGRAQPGTQQVTPQRHTRTRAS